MTTKNIIRLGKTTNSGVIANNLTIKTASRSKPRLAYPEGSVGADLPRRNYIKYLVDRYNHFKQAQKSFGVKDQRFSYAVIYRNIEITFKAQTFFVPVERFQELADFLTSRIDRTILGKRNKAQGIPNYTSFDEYYEQHVASA